MPHQATTLADFREISGVTLDERLRDYYTWQSTRRTDGSWAYDKTLNSAPLPNSSMVDGCGRVIKGPNYCSQDYLSLAHHYAIREAAVSALNDFGVHSAGSTALLGNTLMSRRLEAELAEFLGYEHVLLFPTGWAAGYGIVKGLVRPDDWVVMDVLSHACQQEGARGATTHVASVPHLDNNGFESRLARIRARHPRSFILAVTESVFSMDSDTPDFQRFLDICRRYEAVSLVDVAHDLGCLGPGGLGQLKVQKVVPCPDLLIGSFSKTFASNGGFVAMKDAATKEYLKMYSCPQTFSNALSPIQVAIVRAALRIVTSAEGDRRRRRLYDNIQYLRSLLIQNGFVCLGLPSAIVPVLLGEDGPARLLWQRLSNNGIASNLIEFPGVAINGARIRMQVQCAHNNEDANYFVKKLTAARDSAS
jgi:7-keto-8-aminopelargonate synthetase-like enzyme